MNVKAEIEKLLARDDKAWLWANNDSRAGQILTVMLREILCRAEMHGGAGHPSPGWVKTFAEEHGISLQRGSTND